MRSSHSTICAINTRALFTQILPFFDARVVAL
jgi:hypothetical protein